MKNLKVACIGEAMIELIADLNKGTANLGVAGESLNTAIYLKREIGIEHQVSFVSMLGNDVYSNRILEYISSEGLSTQLITRHAEKLPGLHFINNELNGERSFSYWRENSAARMMFSEENGIPFATLDNYDVIFTSGVLLAILPPDERYHFLDWVSYFRKKGGLFVFDSNYREVLWPNLEEARRAITKAWQCCDIALPSLADEMKLFCDENEEAVLRRLRNLGVHSGVLKRGNKGPVAISENVTFFSSYPPASVCLDSTAAGDSFNGGYLASYLIDEDCEMAAQKGHNLARRVVGFRGAIIPL